MYEYECALTGLTAEAVMDSDNSDELGDLPVGWTRVRMTRRQYNAKWVLLQQVKRLTVENLLQQIPEEVREFQQYAVILQVEAMYHALEQDTPMFAPDVDDVIFVSDSGEVVAELNELRTSLGLESIELPEPLVGNDEDEEEEEEAAPAIEEEAESVPA